MREILFKGKRVDNGEWVEGAYITMHHNDGRTHLHHFIIPDGSDLSYGVRVEDILIEVDPETVCQYTGLTDKNGKKIFEGDIVHCWGGEYCQGFWEIDERIIIEDIRGMEMSLIYHTEFTEVIGNIFDNPDLLTTSSTDP